MRTAVVFIQRCIVILALFLCYFHVRGASVDCEMYPFHHTCRGTMSRKRAMFPIVYGSGCDGNKGSLNCIRELEDRRRVSFVPWSKSKLFLTLFNNDLSKDVKYATRHRQRNSDMDERRPPLMENFLTELESSDNDY